MTFRISVSEAGFPISSLTIAASIPDSKVHGANMGPIWGRQDPGVPHVGPMNLTIWDVLVSMYVGCDTSSMPCVQWVWQNLRWR